MQLGSALPTQLTKLRFFDRFMANHKGYIAGGCFKNLFMSERIKDIDLFFFSETDAYEAKRHYLDNDEYALVRENERVCVFKCKKTGIVIELVFAFFGDPEWMISQFDFSITKAYYSKEEDGSYKFYFHHRFFEHLVNMKLVIDDQVKFPLSTFNRAFRYKGYGFGLCGESKIKLIEALQGATPSTQIDFYFGID